MTATMQSRKSQSRLTVSQGNGARLVSQAVAEHATPTDAPPTDEVLDRLKAQIEAQLYAAIDKARATTRPELFEPTGWAEVFAVGPFQPGATTLPPGPAPYLPHRVIRVGERAIIATILVLNPFPIAGGIIPCDFLSALQLPFTIDYHSCNQSRCEPAQATLNVQHQGQLVAGQCIYVDFLDFIAEEEGCIIETNICARILDCNGQTPSPSPFAGFVRWVLDLDADLFLGSPGLEFDNPVRYMVYE